MCSVSPPKARPRPMEAKEEQFVQGLRLPQYRSAHLSVVPFYSKSKSFVKLAESGHKLLCQQDSQARAKYIIQGTELKTGQEALHFYYIVCQCFELRSNTAALGYISKKLGAK